MAAETTVTSAEGMGPRPQHVHRRRGRTRRPDPADRPRRRRDRGRCPAPRVAYVDDADAPFVPEGRHHPRGRSGASPRCSPATGKIRPAGQADNGAVPPGRHPPSSLPVGAPCRHEESQRGLSGAGRADAARGDAAGRSAQRGRHPSRGRGRRRPRRPDRRRRHPRGQRRHAPAYRPRPRRLGEPSASSRRRPAPPSASSGSGTDDAERRLLDLPCLVSPAMPASTGLVIDRAAVVSAVGPIMVARFGAHVHFKHRLGRPRTTHLAHRLERRPTRPRCEVHRHRTRLIAGRAGAGVNVTTAPRGAMAERVIPPAATPARSQESSVSSASTLPAGCLGTQPLRGEEHPGSESKRVPAPVRDSPWHSPRGRPP